MKKIILILSIILTVVGCAKNNEDTIRFAGSGGYPPFNFMSSDNEVIGFDVDVAREIARRLGKKLKYVTTAWDGIVEGLRAGRYNGILGSMAITEQREKIVDFSVPYYYSGAQLITLKKSDIKKPGDIAARHTLGLVTGTTFEKDAKKLGARIKLYEDDNQTLLELLNGRVDAVITDRVVGLNAMKKIKNGERLTLAGSLLRTEECAVVFKKGDKLRDEVNHILAEMRKDGTLVRISKKWFNGEDITKK